MTLVTLLFMSNYNYLMLTRYPLDVPVHDLTSILASSSMGVLV